MNNNSSDAEFLIKENILRRVEHIQDFTHIPIEDTGLMDGCLPAMRFTQFDDLYDSLIYSNLILKALQMNPHIYQVIDLGAGSSIPSLLALKKIARDDLFLMAVDIDPSAEEVGNHNATVLDQLDRYNFRQGTIEEVIKLIDKKSSEILIVSNPPYISSPLNLKTEKYFIPIDGGLNGDEYLLEILKQEYVPGTTLALLWGSLTCPHAVLHEIESRFEIIHVEAYRVHFGNYTNVPIVKEHLYLLKEEGKVFFENDEEIGEVQLVFGTILKAK